MGVAAAGVAAAERSRADAVSALLFAGSALGVGGLLVANGGYFPAAASWASLAFFWAAVVGLLARTAARPRTLELAFGGALVVLTAWTWLSVGWTSSATDSVWEGERALVLLGGIAAAIALAPRRPMRPLLGGVLTGIAVVSTYSLATRLFPARLGTFDSVSTYRLNTPVGYWNGLGIAVVLGALLALGFALRARRALVAALAGASLLVLLPTLYFTYSRGSWIALAVGLVVALAVDPRRLGLAFGALVLAVAPVVAILVASRSVALTHQAATLAAAKHDGHRLALLLFVLAVAEAALAAALALGRVRVEPARMLQIAWATVLVGAIVLAVVAVVVRYGSPGEIADRAYHSFTAPPVQATNLNQRLFSFSSNGRIDLWQAAVNQWDAHRVLGAGAGTYARWWAAHRRGTQNVQDAHNLYLETLSELGLIGLGLLAVVLALPLAGAWRARRHPLVPLGCAAYAAFLVHAAADWDWELAGVALAAFLCGFSCLVGGRAAEPQRLLGARARYAGAAVGVALALVAFVGLVGNTALERSDAAARARDWSAAARHAHTAIRWMPWSAAGWQRLAEAQLGEKDYAAARRNLAKALSRDRGDWVIWLDEVNATSGRAQAYALRQVVRLNPSDPNLGLLLAAAVRS